MRGPECLLSTVKVICEVALQYILIILRSSTQWAESSDFHNTFCRFNIFPPAVIHIMQKYSRSWGPQFIPEWTLDVNTTSQGIITAQDTFTFLILYNSFPYLCFQWPLMFHSLHYSDFSQTLLCCLGTELDILRLAPSKCNTHYNSASWIPMAQSCSVV